MQEAECGIWNYSGDVKKLSCEESRFGGTTCLHARVLEHRSS
jgi:hypothetical protein